MRRTLALACLLLIVVAATQLADLVRALRSAAVENAPVTGVFGAPIAGLSQAELEQFERGLAVFTRRFGRADGLGPHFNASACTSCHEEPVAGGSAQRYRDFFLVGVPTPAGGLAKTFPDCTDANAGTQRDAPCLPSLVMPHYGPKGSILDPVAAAVEHAGIAAAANVVAARRNAPPLFGIGLFRLIRDEDITARADPTDADGDGISGRFNVISRENDAIGRFGYKCQTASIEAFNRGALHNQMGVTSDSTTIIIGANAPAVRRRSLLEDLLGARTAHAQVASPQDRITDQDEVPDPEIPRQDLLDLIFFQENLAAPERRPVSPAAERGERIFERIGCIACHVRSFETPLGLIHPYTDLLLHDMGPELADGVVMEDAAGSEFRTQPLWGLCEHAPFLHDGRADTVEEAIDLHGGEAERARDAYRALAPDERGDLLRFLESL